MAPTPFTNGSEYNTSQIIKLSADAIKKHTTKKQTLTHTLKYAVS